MVGSCAATPTLTTLAFAALWCAACTVEGQSCDVDGDCGDLVCARDHACTDPDDVRAVRTFWTINGAPADDDTCQGNNLYIEYRADFVEDILGFSPVPCEVGQFGIDKLPTRYVSVELGVEGGFARDTAAIDGGDEVRLDLAF